MDAGARRDADRDGRPQGARPAAASPGLRHGSRTRALLLFDIDGTVLDLDASAAHRDAVYAALRRVYGVADPAGAGVQTWGKTDLQIAREILQACERPTATFHERANEYCMVAAREHEARCAADLSEYVIAGMPELLGELAEREDVLLGLLTGNVRKIAQQKLARAHLDRFFTNAAGGYGCEADDRAALPAIARARARTPAEPHPPERTWIIGDTPHDIQCARSNQIRCIAVTTGAYDAQQLQSADHVAHDAEQLREALDRELTHPTVPI
jgi:phosphoglycolate phosphatase